MPSKKKTSKSKPSTAPRPDTRDKPVFSDKEKGTAHSQSLKDPSEEMKATTSARSDSSKSSKVEASTQEPKLQGKTQRASSTQVEEITTLPDRDQPDIRVKPSATGSEATDIKKEPKQSAEKTRKGKGKKEVEEPSKVIGFKPKSGTEKSRIPRFRVEDAETETEQFYTPSTESPLREQLTTLPEIPPSGVQMPVAEIVPPHEIEEVSKQMEALSIESGRKAARHTPIIPEQEQLTEGESQDKSQVRSTLETVTSLVKEGQVPSNESVTSSINTIQSSGIFENLTTKDSGISSTGEKLVKDTQTLLEATQRVIEEKNAGNLAQDVLKYGARAIEEEAAHAETMSAITQTFGKSSLQDTEVRQSINLTTEKIIALSRLIVGSPEFRDVLGDILDIGKQVLKEEGVDFGEKGEKLGDIIREGGETSGTAVAEIAEKAGDMVKEGGAKAGAKLKKGGQQADKKLKKGEVGKLKEETRSTLDQSREAAGQKLAEIKEDVKSHVTAIPESTSDYLSKAGSKMQYHLEHLPEPQTSHLMESFQSLLRRIQSRPEYTDAVQTIVQLMRKSKESLQKVSEQLGTVGTEVTESENAKIAIDKAKQLVNNFASGGQSYAIANEGTLDDVIEKFGVVKDRVQEDEDFNEWANEVNGWIDYVFSLFDYQADKEPTEYWDQFKEQSKRLLSHTNYLLEERNLYSILDPLTASLSKFVENIRTDRTSNEFAESFNRVVQDLFVEDRTGKMVFKQELVKDLLGVIVPKVIETIGGIPIGRIEKIDDSYTLVLDNIFLNCVILPKNIKVSTESEVVTNQPVIGRPSGDHIRPQATPDLGPVVSATIRVLFKSIQAQATDIVFMYHKKGFLDMGDVGIVDFTIPAPGLDIDLTLQPLATGFSETEETSAGQSQTPPSILRVLRVETSIPDVEINVKKSKHTPETLYKVLHPIINYAAKSAIEKELSRTVEEIVMKADEQLGKVALGGTVPSLKESVMEGARSLVGVREE